MARTETLTRTKAKTTKPPMYKVLLLNDDYSTWDFVVFVLMRFFQKSQTEAEKITRDVHHKGIGIAGVYAFEVAETKVNQVISTARQEGHPLRCTMEPE